MSASESIAAAPIDIWLCYYAELTDPDLQQRLWSLLSEHERERQGRFHFADDRLRFLVTRALVRCVLSRYAPVDPSRWRFVENAYGRPEISPEHAQARGLQFNLSHTQGLIALAIGRDQTLGIDVENFAVRQPSLGIADRFFSAAEAAELAALPASLKPRRFFEYWTFKESYIKARGMGLSLPLDQFSFRYPMPDQVDLDIDPCLQDRPERWRFWQFAPRDHYLLALCVEHRQAPTQAPRMREIVPMLSERTLDLPPLRRSGIHADAGPIAFA